MNTEWSSVQISNTLLSALPPAEVVDSKTPNGSAVSSANRSDLTRSLFADYATETSKSGKRHILDQIVEVNMCVAKSIARRYRGRGESVKDLEQVANLGLLKAVAGFDTSRDRDFLAYAVPTIAGELKRHFRDRCWVVRPPRRIQELKSQIAGCTEMLSQTLGCPPCAGEIASYLDVALEDVNEALRVDSCYRPTSLDIRVGVSGSSSRGELIGANDAGFDRVEIRSVLRPLLDQLPAEDRTIVARRFVDQWTQEQIAQELGVSQMQISRRLSRIMCTLRQQLGEETLST